MEAYAKPLEALGYVHVVHPDDAVCPFFHRPMAWPHTHHVHVILAGSHEEMRTLAFRDYLRDHSVTVREYEDLKRRLAAQHSASDFSSHQAYANAKGAFVSTASSSRTSSTRSRRRSLIPEPSSSALTLLSFESRGGFGGTDLYVTTRMQP